MKNFNEEDFLSLLEDQSKRNPGKMILDDGKGHTYCAFARRVREVASYFSQDVASGRVAVLAADHFEAFAAVLGVSLAGRDALLVNKGLPLSVLTEIIDRADPKLILMDSDVGLTIRSKKILLGSIKADVQKPERNKFTGEIVLFTSGSTGLPKGARLTPTTLFLNARLAAEAVSLASSDKLIINTPPFYASALLHFLAVASVGGTLVAKSGFHFGAALVDEMRERECTGFGGAPAHLIRIFESHGEQALPPKLRFVISSGDHLPRWLIERLLEKYPDLKIHTLYGLTEVSGRLCALNPAELPARAGSVGRPLPGMEVVIRRDDLEPADSGETGELFVSGPMLMKGYLDCPVETEQVLTPYGFRTGDFGYRDANGFIWLQGRRDGVFKSGAEKVSVQLIQETIMGSGLFRDAIVTAVEDTRMGKIPVAYLVPKDPSTFGLESFKRWIRNRLVASHHPKRWEIVPDIPRTGSGKVIKHANWQHK